MNDFDKIINRYGTNSCKWDEAREKCGKDVLQLAVADMDFKSPTEIIEKMKEIVEHGVFGYTMLPNSYYDSIISWYLKRYNSKIEKDWILYSPRVGIGISLIIQKLTEIGDGIILHTPEYPTLREVILKNNRKLISLPMILKDGKYNINIESLEKLIDKNTKMFIICNPHNPTGRVFTYDELLEIVNFCKKHNIIIVSDEIHGDLVFKKYKHIPIIEMPEAKEISIICSSITKTFNVPGVITSNLIIPNEKIRNEVKEILDVSVIHNPNIFAASITEIAYDKCEYWLDNVMEYVENNKEYLKKYINENIQKLKVIDSEGTYLIWICYKQLNINEKEFNELLISKANVNVYMGSHFGKSGEGFIRVNLATPKENIVKFLINLKKILEYKNF